MFCVFFVKSPKSEDKQNFWVLWVLEGIISPLPSRVVGEASGISHPKGFDKLISRHWYPLGRFIFHRTQLFQAFGASPVSWDLYNKAMLFFSHGNCFFFGSLMRDKMLKKLLKVVK